MLMQSPNSHTQEATLQIWLHPQKVLLKKVAEEKAREGPWNHCHQHTFMGQAYQRCYLESK